MAGTARYDQESRRTRQALWVGFALAVALLAHDALMGAAAHSAHAISARFSHNHDLSGPSARTAGTEVDLAVDHGPSSPGEADDCGQTRPALPTGDHLDIAGDAPAGIVAIAGLGRLTSAQRWSKPTWPPGKLRALTQVYRV